jgi:hypothetical protein
VESYSPPKLVLIAPSLRLALAELAGILAICEFSWVAHYRVEFNDDPYSTGLTGFDLAVTQDAS